MTDLTAVQLGTAARDGFLACVGDVAAVDSYVREGGIVPATTSDRPDGRLMSGPDEIVIRSPACDPEPMFYTRRDDVVIVGSNVAEVARCTAHGPAISPGGLYSVLSYGATPAPLSIFQNVARLPGGFDLRIGRGGDASLRPWWPEAEAEAGADSDARSVNALVLDRLRLSLGSVRDGAVVLFSGGVDSALSAAVLSQDLGLSVTLANMGFGEDDEEARVAVRMARALGLRLEQYTFGPAQVTGVIQRLPDEYGFPFADYSTLPMNELVWAGVRGSGAATVVDGTGADGLFAIGGRVAMWRALARIPASVHQSIAHLYGRLGAWRWSGLGRKLLRLPRAVHLDGLVPAAVMSQHTLQGIAYNVPDPVREEIRAAIEISVLGPGQGLSLVQQLGFADLIHVCAGVYAAKAARPIRSAGARALFPFLEPGMLDLLLDRPEVAMPQGRERKWILKEELARRVPRELVYRRKSGFRPPLEVFLRTPEAGEMVEDIVFDSGNPVLPFVDGPFNRALIRDVRLGIVSNKEVLNYLWAVLFLSVWLSAHAS